MDNLQLRKNDIVPGWSSHLPILIKALQHTSGPVLELGAGLFSTPVLHWLCEEQKRKLITLESDLKFFSFMKVFRSITHGVRFVEDWDKENLDRKWGVALIDHARGRRAIDALRLRDNTKYIIIHDTQERHYEKFRFNDAFWTNFKYVYHWRYADTSTTVVSNKSDLKIFSDKRTSKLKSVRGSSRISFFAKRTYLLPHPDGGVFLQRVSARVRGEEMSTYLKAKYNPTGGYEKDVRIYVKPHSLDHIKNGSYIDVLDDSHGVGKLKDRPGLKVIAMSQVHYEYLKNTLKNDIFSIPHHHVNFERAKRDRKEIRVCGYIGSPRHSDKEIKKVLSQAGLEYKPLTKYQTRQDIIDYYKTIDIQVIGYFGYHDQSPYRHPTKIFNAASFGIPTIAASINGYKEAKHYYVPVNDMRHLQKEVIKMKQKKQYKAWSDKVAKKAEKYHIEKIAKLYKKLK